MCKHDLRSFGQNCPIERQVLKTRGTTHLCGISLPSHRNNQHHHQHQQHQQQQQQQQKHIDIALGFLQSKHCRMRGAGIKHRTTHHSLYTVTATPCEDRRDNGSARIGGSAGVISSTGSIVDSIGNNGNKDATVGTSGCISMRVPWLLRTLRIGCVLVLLLYVWSSAGDIVATVEMDSKGKVQKADDSLLQQQQQQQGNRQMSLSNHPETQQQQRHEQPLTPHQRQQEHTPFPIPTTTSDCGMYLAPSTIPGAGLGMFTAYHRSEGDMVGRGEVAIPLVEINFYNGGKEELFNPFVHYQWKGKEMSLHGIVAEHRANQVQALVPGINAAINCNLALINLDMSGSEYDDGNLHRYRDSMAGSASPYHSTPSRVLRDIPAGGELFKFYGDRWFAARKESFGLIPLSDDYPAAQRIVNKFDELRQEHFVESRDLQRDLWSLLKDTIGSEMWESRTMNALPANVTAAKKAAETEIASLHQPHAIRSVDYLREHGKCVDSIRHGPSSLESHQGGRGAFATRLLVKGGIITGTPLNHVPKKDLVTIFKMERNSTDNDTGGEVWLRHMDEVIGYQTILNYCYGHPQSTMLLCPYGAGVNYINHNRTRANVKIQWAQDGMTSHNNTWLYKRRVEDLEWDYSVGLAFDYVATADIQEGEELFLDYGDEFEEALAHYTSTWTPPASNGGYIPAQRFNRLSADAPMRTESEQKDEPYPGNLEVRCHSDLVTKQKRNASNKTGFHWESREFGVPCRVLERIDGEASEVKSNFSLYKIELKVPLEEVGLQQRSDTFTYIQRKNVSQSAMRFFNRPYTTDLFLPNVFRKEIGIPDSMFPGQWRNSVPRSPHEEFSRLLFGDLKV